MVRLALLAAAIAGSLSTPAFADPQELCGLEETHDKPASSCPSYVTYDEEGKEISGKAGR